MKFVFLLLRCLVVVTAASHFACAIGPVEQTSFRSRSSRITGDILENPTSAAHRRLGGQTSVNGTSTDQDQGEEVLLLSSESFKVLASDGNSSDYFGYAVDIHGDIAIVGAHYDDDDVHGYSDTGSAYIFTRSRTTSDGGSWKQEQKLVPGSNDVKSNQKFGRSVAIRGHTVIVGAPLDKEQGVGGGAAYVFTRTPKSSTLCNNTLGSNCGNSTKSSNCTNRTDSSNCLSNTNSSNCNSTTTIRNCTDTNSCSCSNSTNKSSSGEWVWVQDHKLTAISGSASDYFGYSVAIHENETIVVVGASGDDDVAYDSGAAYIFIRSEDVGEGEDNGGVIGRRRWKQEQKLRATDGGTNDYFGCSVDIQGDTILVGAYGDNGNGGLQRGAAYIFTSSSSFDALAEDGGSSSIRRSFVQHEKLVAIDGENHDQFGYSISLDKNENTAVIGARRDGNYRGSAYVFARNSSGEGSSGSNSNSSWTQQQKLIANDSAIFDRFGHTVDIDGDTIVVGAYGSQDYRGSAYIFSRSSSSSASVGINDDGNVSTIDFAGIYDDGNVPSVDSVSINDDGNGTEWTERIKLVASDGLASDSFGISVALDAGTAFVGAAVDDHVCLKDGGSTYVFCVTAMFHRDGQYILKITTDPDQTRHLFSIKDVKERSKGIKLRANLTNDMDTNEVMIDWGCDKIYESTLRDLESMAFEGEGDGGDWSIALPPAEEGVYNLCIDAVDICNRTSVLDTFQVEELNVTVVNAAILSITPVSSVFVPLNQAGRYGISFHVNTTGFTSDELMVDWNCNATSYGKVLSDITEEGDGYIHLFMPPVEGSHEFCLVGIRYGFVLDSFKADFALVVYESDEIGPDGQGVVGDGDKDSYSAYSSSCSETAVSEKVALDPIFHYQNIVMKSSSQFRKSMEKARNALSSAQHAIEHAQLVMNTFQSTMPHITYELNDAIKIASGVYEECKTSNQSEEKNNGDEDLDIPL